MLDRCASVATINGTPDETGGGAGERRVVALYPLPSFFWRAV
ncbi:hypothetical protein SAMN05421507_111222 [Lentzea jiangxiensis]|uniref:Uncharacterized protein n=1 Tax=Lentzea jiangxiensis TaxID=641025 RepID=A0A1H0UAJ3_9PSEU|nr:hypothetical protein SAMN05421507_111222 [Lentzea jiangxiensis]